MIKSTALSALFLSLAVISAAHAADNSRAARAEAELKSRFAKADVNGDGKLAREEAKDVMPRVYANFDKIDVHHSGYVTIEDINSFMMDKMAARKASAE